MSDNKPQEDEEFKEPEIGFAKFDKPGDQVTGTYTGKQNVPAKGIYGEQIAYTLLVDGNEIVVALGLGKKWVHSAMKGAKIGQRVRFLFEDWFEQPAYKEELARVLAKVNPDGSKGTAEDCKISRSKSIKVLLGKMDETYLNGFEEVKSDDVDENGFPKTFK